MYSVRTATLYLNDKFCGARTQRREAKDQCGADGWVENEERRCADKTGGPRQADISAKFTPRLSALRKKSVFVPSLLKARPAALSKKKKNPLFNALSPRVLTPRPATLKKL